MDQYINLKIIKKDIFLKEINSYDEILLLGSGKGVTSVKTINEIKWKRKNLDKFSENITDFDYFEDYEAALSSNEPTLYHVKDSWSNYQKLAPLITSAFKNWKKPERPKWWKFWE